LLIHFEAVPPVVTLALPLEVAPLVTFLRGAIADKRGNLRKVEEVEILSVRIQISMKAPKNVGINSQKRFIYNLNCNLDLRDSTKNNRKDTCFT